MGWTDQPTGRQTDRGIKAQKLILAKVNRSAQKLRDRHLYKPYGHRLVSMTMLVIYDIWAKSQILMDEYIHSHISCAETHANLSIFLERTHNIVNDIFGRKYSLPLMELVYIYKRLLILVSIWYITNWAALEANSKSSWPSWRLWVITFLGMVDDYFTVDGLPYP